MKAQRVSGSRNFTEPGMTFNLSSHEKGSEGSRHRLGRRNMDSYPAMDGGRQNAESGEADESRRLGRARVHSPADYSAGLDLVHDREESGQTRHLSFCRNGTRRLRDELRERNLAPFADRLEAFERRRLLRRHDEHPVHLSAGTV